MEEHRLRLQEAANRQVSWAWDALPPPSPFMGGEGGGPAAPRARVPPPLRRFSSNAVLTPEEQEQRAIYAAILEYEQDHVRKQAPGLTTSRTERASKKQTGRG